MNKPIVLIVIGSENDLPIMKETSSILTSFGICYRLVLASAHRAPEKVAMLSKEAEKEGIQIIIAGAGMAAHLAGAFAAHTILPVIGVPINASLSGFDALLSTVQMPGGVPVATVSIGKAGAKNAGLLAAQILALNSTELREKLHDYKETMAQQIEDKQLELER
ncbi:MAG: 5-(carboxyamino)imidazole ribonucleotide mutase [bacterium]